MFERLTTVLRAIADGVSHPAYGACSGDPIAWEKDLLRRRTEAAEVAGHPAPEPLPPGYPLPAAPTR